MRGAERSAKRCTNRSAKRSERRSADSPKCILTFHRSALQSYAKKAMRPGRTALEFTHKGPFNCKGHVVFVIMFFTSIVARFTSNFVMTGFDWPWRLTGHSYDTTSLRCFHDDVSSCWRVGGSSTAQSSHHLHKAFHGAVGVPRCLFASFRIWVAMSFWRRDLRLRMSSER